MSTTIAPHAAPSALADPPAPGSRAGLRPLHLAARLWFVAMLLGHLGFVAYLATFYGVTTFGGRFAEWDRNRMLPVGHVAGDTVGNLMFAAHALVAIVVVLGGTVQLVPWLRRRAIAVHRWNGRVFLVSAMLAAAGGLYLSLVRSRPAMHDLALVVDAVLIAVFGAIAWRTARRGETRAHRVWALRTYLVVNAVWFQRVGFIAFMVTSRAFGDGGGMDVFFRYWAWGSYLLPLLLLELYLSAERRGSLGLRAAVAVSVGVGALVVAGGAAGLFAFILWPLMRAV